MPKVRVKNTGRGKMVRKLRNKFRIGTRKNGFAGHTMTNEALLEVVNDTDKKRYHHNARIVLGIRGITEFVLTAA